MAKTPSEKSSQRQHEAMPEGAEFGTGVAKAAAERLLGEDRPPNVIGFGHGVKWTNNQPTGDDALLVFVEQKLDVPAAERVPAEIGGKQTDVVAIGTVMAQQLLRDRTPLDHDGVSGEPKQLGSSQRAVLRVPEDRKSTRLNSSHITISYDV